MNKKLERLYRLMVLYLVKNSKKSLSNTDIMTFFVDNKYLDYFGIQEIINGLVETKHLIDISNNNKTKYFISDIAEDSLKQLNNFIPPAIVEDLDEYIKINYEKQFNF